MNTALWQKLDQAARNITPFLLTLVLVFISVLPTRIPIYAEVAPVLALVAVYHWAIYRPNLMPLWCVFLLGLFQDLLSGMPLGLYCLVFLTVYGLALTQRRFFAGKSFYIYWMGFVVIAFVAAVESWLVASIWHFAVLNFETVFFQYLVSLGIFPIVAWIFLRWQQAFLHQEYDAAG